MAQDEVIVVVSAPPPITSLATGGGGEGPASSTSIEVNATVQGEKAFATLTNISKGSTGRIFIPDSTGVPFSEIAIKMLNNVSNVKLTVYKLAEKPSDIAPDISGVAHSYIQIDESNIRATDIDSVTITFKVPVSWIDNNNINKSTVTPNRYADEKWTALATTKSSEDSNYVYYLATSPGLSVFGISGQVQAVTTTTLPVTTTTAAPPTVAPRTITLPAAPITIAPSAEEAKLSKPIAKLAVAIVLIAIIAGAAYYFYQKKGTRA